MSNISIVAPSRFFSISFKIKPDVTSSDFTTQKRVFTTFWFQNCNNYKVLLPWSRSIWKEYFWFLPLCGSAQRYRNTRFCFWFYQNLGRMKVAPWSPGSADLCYKSACSTLWKYDHQIKRGVSPISYACAMCPFDRIARWQNFLQYLGKYQLFAYLKYTALTVDYRKYSIISKKYQTP